jgi:hypothetical protein
LSTPYSRSFASLRSILHLFPSFMFQDLTTKWS